MSFRFIGERGRFRVVDALVITSLLLLIGGCLLLGSLADRDRHPTRIVCITHLKQLATAFMIWAQDHEEHYPAEVSIKRGGIRDSPFQHNLLSNYLIASREITDPKILSCPRDKKRKPAESWSTLTENNLSYFLNIGATYGISPSTNNIEVLVGDRNVAVYGRPARGYIEATNANSFGWTNWLHVGGDIALEDASAHQTSDRQFREYLEQSPSGSMRLLLP